MLIRLAVENQEPSGGDYSIDLAPLTVLVGRGASPRAGLFRPLLVLQDTVTAPPWRQTIALLAARGVQTDAEMIASCSPRGKRLVDVTLAASWGPAAVEGSAPRTIDRVDHAVRYGISPAGSPWLRSSVFRAASESYAVIRDAGGGYRLGPPIPAGAPEGDDARELALGLTRDLRRLHYLGPRRAARGEGHTLSDPRLEKIGAAGEGMTEALIADLRRAEAAGKSRGPLCEQASKWISRLGLGERVELEKAGQIRYRIVVVAPGGLRVPLHRCDSSVVRVLPVILLACTAREGSTVILERPEEGISEAAQAGVGEMLAEVGKARGVQFLVEAAGELLSRGAGEEATSYQVEPSEDGALRISRA